MAVPEHFPTDRGRYLHRVFSDTSFSEALAWPGFTEADAIMVAQIVTDYSQIDMMMAMLVDAIDRFDPSDLPAGTQGKTSKLRPEDLENALKGSRWIGAERAEAFDRISQLRKTRNLVAHFVMRRFPTEDAIVFMTKSDRDFKKVMGREPIPGGVLVSFCDATELAIAADGVRLLTDWLCDTATEVDAKLNDFGRRSPTAPGGR